MNPLFHSFDNHSLDHAVWSGTPGNGSETQSKSVAASRNDVGRCQMGPRSRQRRKRDIPKSAARQILSQFKAVKANLSQKKSCMCLFAKSVFICANLWRKIKVNQAWSRLIKVNQAFLEHFFSAWFGSNRSGRVKVSQTGSNLASFCLCAFSFLLFLLIAPPRCGAEPPPPDPTNEPLKQISRDVFQLGPVRLDKSRKTVQFPAQLNMNDGLIEYLLVNSKGKAYESLLRTDTEPYSIQLAMLLIGAKRAPQTPALLNAPSVPFHVNRHASATNSPPLAIQGDPVTIELAWQTPDGTKQLPAEDCIMNLTARTNASRGPWTYNGSRVVNGFFLAQREGSIVAMIDDIDAMVNNPRPGSDNDQIWQINSNTLPPLNTPVEVTFKLETPANK
jgi:hypothetical protein